MIITALPSHTSIRAQLSASESERAVSSWWNPISRSRNSLHPFHSHPSTCAFDPGLLIILALLFVKISPTPGLFLSADKWAQVTLRWDWGHKAFIQQLTNLTNIYWTTVRDNSRLCRYRLSWTRQPRCCSQGIYILGWKGVMVGKTIDK